MDDLKDKIYSFFEFNKSCNRRIILACNLYKKGKFGKILSFFLHKMNRKKYNIEIYPSVIIGKNFYIPHCVGIVIGKTAQIGKNCIIFPNVVIGARYSPMQLNPVERRHAIIGDNCILGAGCKIIGDVVIGNNVIIGANAIVTIDIPDNSVVKNVNEYSVYR